MCICNIFSRNKLSGEISRSANEIPEGLEKMRIPHISHVKMWDSPCFIILEEVSEVEVNVYTF